MTASGVVFGTTSTLVSPTVPDIASRPWGGEAPMRPEPVEKVTLLLIAVMSMPKSCSAERLASMMRTSSITCWLSLTLSVEVTALGA